MWRRKNILLGLLISILILWFPAVWILASALVVTKSIEDADAIYVLSGSADHAERALEAAKLFREKKASKILLTDDRLQGGWNNELERNPFFVERTKWLLIDGGVPENRIEILPDKINGTEEEASVVVSYLCRTDTKKLLLVTSAYHSRRSLTIFEDTADQCDKPIEFGISHPETGLVGKNKLSWWFQPKLIKRVASEYAKFIGFYL